MDSLIPQFKVNLERIVREEISVLSKKERGHFLLEVSNYIQNLCPKHPNHSERYKCENCSEDCKYG